MLLIKAKLASARSSGASNELLSWQVPGELARRCWTVQPEGGEGVPVASCCVVREDVGP